MAAGTSTSVAMEHRVPSWLVSALACQEQFDDRGLPTADVAGNRDSQDGVPYVELGTRLGRTHSTMTGDQGDVTPVEAVERDDLERRLIRGYAPAQHRNLP